MSLTTICPECAQPVTDTVCHACGLVLDDSVEMKNTSFEYTSKNQVIIHHQILLPHASLTTIGSKAEQMIYAYKGMDRLAKTHAWSTKSKSFKMYSECYEIFKNLTDYYNLDINSIRSTLELMLNKIYVILPPHSRVKNTTLVACTVFYYYCKSQHMYVNLQELLSLYSLSKSQFWNFVRVLNNLPAFKAVHSMLFSCKSDYETVIKSIYNLCAEFKLGDRVYNQAVLTAPKISGKSQIVAVVAVSQALIELKLQIVKPYIIANWLHIAISTVYAKLSDLAEKSPKILTPKKSLEKRPCALPIRTQTLYIGGLQILPVHCQEKPFSYNIIMITCQEQYYVVNQTLVGQLFKKVDNTARSLWRYLQDRGKNEDSQISFYIRDRGKMTVCAG